MSDNLSAAEVLKLKFFLSALIHSSLSTTEYNICQSLYKGSFTTLGSIISKVVSFISPVFLSITCF